MNNKNLRTGVVLTVFMNELPKAHSNIPFEEVGLQHLGIDTHEIENAEIVRIATIDLHNIRILKDRYGGTSTQYNHKDKDASSNKETSVSQLMDDNFCIPMPIIRRTDPVCFASHIKPITPRFNDTNIKYEHIQKVIVFDPRLCMSFNTAEFDDKIQIQRIIVSEPIEKNDTTNIRYQEIVEILKEYSFDAWDNRLNEYIDAFDSCKSINNN